MALTQTTNTVISANTITWQNLANYSVQARHVNTNTISLDMLTANVTANLITGGGTQTDINFSNRFAGSTLVEFDIPNSNITFIAGHLDTTAPNAIHRGDMVITGNLQIQGPEVVLFDAESFTNSSNLILNEGGSVPEATGVRLVIEGGGQRLANVVYAPSAINKFRMGTGTLGLGNDVLVRNDIGTNLIPFANTYTSDGSNTMIINAPGQPATKNFVTFSLGGVNQSSNEWVLNGNNTLTMKDSTVPSGLRVTINVLFPT